MVPQERIEVQMNTSSTSTSSAIPVIESVTPAPVVTFNPVSECASVDGTRLPAPVQCLLLLLPCNRSLPKGRHRTLFLRLFVPVTQASTPGGNAHARSLALATGTTRARSVFSTHMKIPTAPTLRRSFNIEFVIKSARKLVV